MDPVLSRRSTQEYTDQPVSDEMVRTLLKAAMSAPSAGDERPWHFVVIRDRLVRERIPEVHRFAPMAPFAPVALLVCGDESLQKHRGFWVQDCAAATENVLIEAQLLGLGADWLGVYPVEGRVQGFRRLLNIPERVIPFALVLVGYPAQRKKPAERYDESRVHTNGWDSSGSGNSRGPLARSPGNGQDEPDENRRARQSQTGREHSPNDQVVRCATDLDHDRR